MIELILCQWLRDSAAVTAAVPNIFAITLPKNLLYPSVRISTLNNDIEQTFGGVTGDELANIQIDYWAASTNEIAKIKKALVTFLNSLTDNEPSVYCISNLREQPSYEEKTHIFKQTLELTLSYKELS
ncbi:MAG: hypothetical protein ACJAUY_000668 [Cognaticolwellia sp.]|jgi:hypothetical protein